MEKYKILCELNRKEQLLWELLYARRMYHYREFCVFRQRFNQWMKSGLTSCLNLWRGVSFFGPGQAASQKKIPLSYLLMVFTDINNDKTRNLLRQKKEWLVDLLRRGWLTGKLSNGKISEGDTYNLLYKYIIRNAICTLPEYPQKEDFRIYINDADERCYCEMPE